MGRGLGLRAKARGGALTCSSGEKDMRPAESLTIDLGMMMRAVAMVRAIWKQSGVSPPSIMGVPSMGTRALIGTDSGCSGMVESCSTEGGRGRQRCVRGREG